MKSRRIAVFFGAMVLGAFAAGASAQESPLPLPSPVEKELAARASDVTEVTLGKNMLAFAAKVMNGKDKDDEATRRLIEGLEGIYVREYEFDKEGAYNMEQVEQLRKHFETSEWSAVVRARERGSRETTDVMVKLVKGEPHGIFILATEPKELTIVLILGPIRMEDLGRLKDISGVGGALGPLGPLGGVQHTPRGKKGGTE